MPMSLPSSGAPQQFKNDKNDFFFTLGCAACDCLPADADRAAVFSVVAALACCDRLLLVVLPALLRPVKLLFEPLPILSAGSLAVAPLRSVVDEAFCCGFGTSRREFRWVVWTGCSVANESDTGALLLLCIADDVGGG